MDWSLGAAFKWGHEEEEGEALEVDEDEPSEGAAGQDTAPSTAAVGIALSHPYTLAVCPRHSHASCHHDPRRAQAVPFDSAHYHAQLHAAVMPWELSFTELELHRIITSPTHS